MKRQKRDHIAETIYHLRQRLDLVWRPHLEARRAKLAKNIEAQRAKEEQAAAQAAAGKK